MIFKGFDGEKRKTIHRILGWTNAALCGGIIVTGAMLFRDAFLR
jgi:hypothetical protein